MKYITLRENTEILVQYHSKATDTVCSIKLKREELLYIRTIVNFQAECVLIYMLLFYQISAWVFLIHMLLYAGFYCIPYVDKDGAVIRAGSLKKSS